MKEVYLDLENGTPLPPAILEVMLPYFNQKAFGHSALTHKQGWDAYAEIQAALGKIAAALGCAPEELAVVHDAVEAANLAVEGLVLNRPVQRKKILLSAIEPLNIIYAAERLEKQGFTVQRVPVDKEGFVDKAKLGEMADDQTFLVAVSWANHEIGTIQPLEDLAAIVKAKAPEAYFLCDLCDAFGRMKFDISKLPIDLGLVSSYKIFGPKGVAVLYKGHRAKIQPLLSGPYSTQPLWPGDENLPLLAGFAEAASQAREKLDERAAHMKRLAHKLRDGLLKIPHTMLNGSRDRRIPDNVNISFMGSEGEAITVECSDHGVYVSSGSACTRRILQPSHVLLALGKKYEEAHGSILMKISPFHTDADIDYVLEVFPQVIARIRKISGFKEA